MVRLDGWDMNRRSGVSEETNLPTFTRLLDLVIPTYKVSEVGPLMQKCPQIFPDTVE